MKCTLKLPQAFCLVVASIVIMLVVSCSVSNDTSMRDSAWLQDDPTVQEQMAFAVNMEKWIEQIDPYVSESSDRTYVVDWNGFKESIKDSDPMVYSYLSNGQDQGNQDAQIVSVLRDGIPVVNNLILEDGAAWEENDIAKSTYRTYYWWGVKQCFTGSDAGTMAYVMSLGTGVTWFSGIGWVANALLTAYSGTAWYLTSYCGGFCINTPWTLGYFWLTCP